jgi:hypothetical protein
VDHLKQLLDHTDIVPAVLQRLKRKRTNSTTLLLAYLDVLFQVAKESMQNFCNVKGTGLRAISNCGGIDKIILLLCSESEEALEYGSSKILSLFYKSGSFFCI